MCKKWHSLSLLFCWFLYWFKFFVHLFFKWESSVSVFWANRLSVLWFTNLATAYDIVHEGVGVAGLGACTANDKPSSLLDLSSLSAFAHAVPSSAIFSSLSAQKAPAPPAGQPSGTHPTHSADDILYNICRDEQEFTWLSGGVSLPHLNNPQNLA